MGLHPSDVIIGYEKASKKLHELFEDQTCYECTDVTNYDEVFKCMKSAIMSKQYGLEDLLGGLITKAVLMAISSRTKKFHSDNIRV